MISKKERIIFAFILLILIANINISLAESGTFSVSARVTNYYDIIEIAHSYKIIMVWGKSNSEVCSWSIDPGQYYEGTIKASIAIPLDDKIYTIRSLPVETGVNYFVAVYLRDECTCSYCSQCLHSSPRVLDARVFTMKAGETKNIDFTSSRNVNGIIYEETEVCLGDAEDSFTPLEGSTVEIKEYLTGNTVKVLTTDQNGFFNSDIVGEYTVPSHYPKYYISYSKGGYYTRSIATSEYPFFLGGIHKKAGTLYGIVKGTDNSDPSTQMRLGLVRVNTTVNGRKYLTRTDKNGTYILDFSDQATLPSTIEVTASQEFETYETQTQQATPSLTYSINLNFVLNKEFLTENATADTIYTESSALYLTGDSESQGNAIYFAGDIPVVIKGSAIDMKSGKIVSGINIILKNSAGITVASTLTNSNGFYIINVNLNEGVYRLIAWHNAGTYKIWSDSIPVAVFSQIEEYNIDIFLQSSSPTEIRPVTVKYDKTKGSWCKDLEHFGYLTVINNSIINRIAILQNNVKRPSIPTRIRFVSNLKDEAEMKINKKEKRGWLGSVFFPPPPELSDLKTGGTEILVNCRAFYEYSQSRPGEFDRIANQAALSVTHEFGHLYQDSKYGWEFRHGSGPFWKWLYDQAYIRDSDPACDYLKIGQSAPFPKTCFFVPLSTFRDNFAKDDGEPQQFYAEAFTIVNDPAALSDFLYGNCQSNKPSYACYNDGPKKFSAFAFNAMATSLGQTWKLKGLKEKEFRVPVNINKKYDFNKILQGNFKPIP